MDPARILLVDDDDMVLLTLSKVLKLNGFDVTTASNVAGALRLIISTPFDILLSDLHMPGAGDGLTVVSAMRHANPKAVTMLLTAYPAMGPAAHAIVLQADEILVKPMDANSLVATIRQRLANGPQPARAVESIAAILQRSAQSTTDNWFTRIQTDPEIMAIPLSREQRCAHLPQLFSDLVDRLNRPKELGSKEPLSPGAAHHGTLRRNQGYTAAMMVEESRELQVSIFQTLQDNILSIDFSALLPSIMTIADEVDSQLSQAMKCYIAEPAQGARPALSDLPTTRASTPAKPPTALGHAS